MAQDQDQDYAKAQDLRAKLNSALMVVCGIVDTAKNQGFIVGYATGEVDGQQVVTRIEILKKL